MKKLLLLASLLPLTLIGQQHHDSIQNDSSEHRQKKFVKFVSISGYAGGDFYRDGFEDRTIFQQAAPNSVVAFADISGYTNWDGSMFYMGTRTAMTSGLNVNLHLRCQKKFGELRFGISHSIVNVASQQYTLQSTTSLDTTALPGGQTLYTDSVATSSYSLGWNADVIHLNIAWIVRSDPRRWINLYTGVGFFAGIGYNGIITTSHYHNSYHQHTIYGSGGGGGMYTSNHEQLVEVVEQFRAPMFTSFGVYTPIGMNIRLGHRKNIFGHLAVFGEYNGAIMFVNPEGTNSKIRTVSTMYGGVRWYVHAPGKPKGKGKNHHSGHRHHHHRDENRENGNEPR